MADLENDSNVSVDSPERQKKVYVIEPRRGLAVLRLDEVWEYRELIGLLAWRDLSVRYKQTIVGALWALLQPLVLMFLFSVIFRRWVGMPSQGTPYPLYCFVAMLPWTYFSSALSSSASGLLRSASVLTKVYFPRLVIPISAVIPPVVDFSLSIIVLLWMCYAYNVGISVRWFLIAPLLLLTLLWALGLGLWLSALSVEYRDVSYVMPFLMQFLLFASPVVYPSNVVSWRWRELYSMNPMVGIIEGFRWVILGVPPTSTSNIQDAFFVVILVLITGVIYFQHQEKSFADVV